MSQKKEGVCFTCTAEQEADLKRVISELKDTAGALMPILQHAQEIFGYLPIEVQTMISDETGIPLEKIYGVATFYSQFSLQPKGQYRIFSRNSKNCLASPTANVRPTVNSHWIPAAVSEPADWPLS